VPALEFIAVFSTTVTLYPKPSRKACSTYKSDANSISRVTNQEFFEPVPGNFETEQIPLIQKPLFSPWSSSKHDKICHLEQYYQFKRYFDSHDGTHFNFFFTVLKFFIQIMVFGRIRTYPAFSLLPVLAGPHNFGFYLLSAAILRTFSLFYMLKIYFQNAKHKDIFRLLAPGPGAEDLRQAGHLALPGGDQEVRQRRDQRGDRQVTGIFHPENCSLNPDHDFFLNPDLNLFFDLKITDIFLFGSRCCGIGNVLMPIRILS
jgi:hypothetical protein